MSGDKQAADTPFVAFYDAGSQMFTVDFTGVFPFAAASHEIKSSGMFTHGICTDGAQSASGSGYTAFNRIGITEKHLPSDSLPEGLEYRLGHAASKLSRMYEGAPHEAIGSIGHLRCEKAAQLIVEHQAQMINDLVASYNEYKRSELV